MDEKKIEEIRNKAVDFFGEDIVEKLEEQHQEGYPSYFKREKYNMDSRGDEGVYIVPFNKKEYKVTVKDNIYIHPLYINIITDWVEVKKEEHVC